MAPKLHPFDILAEDLAEWIENMSEQLADAIQQGGRSPFAANVSPAKQLAYYDAAFFNPDGSPNMAGRQAQMQRLGLASYAKAMSKVLMSRQQGEGETPAGAGIPL